MRATRAAATFATLVTLAAFGPAAHAQAAPSAEPAAAKDTVSMVVLREDGVGGAARAREYLAAIIDAVAQANGWPASSFDYFTDRAKAQTWIDEHDPSFGILSFGAFLAMHAPSKLSVVGTAKAVGSGGVRYYIVSVRHHDLGGCKSGTLVSNHAGDAKYIDKVVSAGVFALSDFAKVEHSKRPVQTLKMVIRGEADCALIDHAQFEAMQEIDEGASLSTVWFSQEFPSIVMVAFPKASAAQSATFHDKLDGVCRGDGKKACERAGVKTMVGVAADAYDAQVKAYEG
jgi:hypothetical protein